MARYRPLLYALMPLMLFATACGGGDTAPPLASVTAAIPPVPPPPPSGSSSDPIFTPGLFEPAATFIDRCQVVRAGRDIEGNLFRDTAGSSLIEKFWLRSWTNETYLWPDEVTDRDPNLIEGVTDYFAVLRTEETTPSGEDKDDFHFSEPTEAFLARRTSAATPGYGARFIGLSRTVPRDFRVLFTEPGSPAATTIMGQANLVRGSRILSIDGIDFVNGANTQADIERLNRGLFPQAVGESHTFTVRDPGSTQPRTITLTAQNISPRPVNRVNVIDTPQGKVGYILFNTFSPFSSEEAIARAFSRMKAEGVNDLVLDLRYNGGGLLAVASQLSYMIAGPDQTRGRIFEMLRFNGKTGNRNPVTGQPNNPIPFYDSGLGFSLVNGEALESLDLQRVFILSTEGTCSASEAVINGLDGIDVEVILIGNTTCGKPFGFYPTDNCGETYYTIQFQGVNDAGFGDYTDGFTPSDSGAEFGVKLAGCTVVDDLSTELGQPDEGLLSAALNYRETGNCPVQSTASSPKVSVLPAGSSGNKAAGKQDSLEMPDPNARLEADILLNNRDMRMPF